MKRLNRIFCGLAVLMALLCLAAVMPLGVSAATTVTKVYVTVPTPIIGDRVGDAVYGYSGTTGVKVTDVNWTDINGAIYSDDHRFQQGVTYYCDVEFQVEAGYTFPASYTQLSGYVNNQAGEISTVYYTDHAYVTWGVKPKLFGDVYVGGVGVPNNRYYSVLTGTITTDKPSDNYVHYKDGVLTLHNFTYKGLGRVLNGSYSPYSAGIYSEKPLTIVLEGNNTIQVTDKAARTLAFYVLDNDLSITGTANSKLTASGSYAVSLSDKLTIDGGSYVFTSDSDALYARSDCTIQNCNLNITSTEAGVYTRTNLSLKGVDATITAEEYHALYAGNILSVSGCDLSIETGDSGLYCVEAQVESSTLDVTAYDSGMEIWGEDSTIKNCFISIEGDYGIYADGGDLSLEGCTISIEAVEAGIMTDGSNLYVTDCRITAYSSRGDALTALDGSVIFGEGLGVRATTEKNGEWVPYIAADAKYYYCVDVHKHLADNGTVTRDSTCKQVGLRVYKCTVCDEVIATHTIPKASHSYKAATCTAPKTCTVCGATSGSKLGHTYEKKTTKATLTKDGSSKNVCKDCGYTASSVTTIYKASSIKLSKTSYTYNGKVQKPTVTVKDSKGNTIASSNYTVTYAGGCKSAGTYKVTVKMKGNYSGTKTLSYTIKPIDVSKCTVTLSATSYTYDGKVKKPTVTVKNPSGTKLTEGGSYTVTYASGRKNVGTYKVTVKMKGNYTGTKTVTFKILPAKTSISSVTAGSKKLTVKWAKKTTQVTGYEIQYSTSKTFSSAKTKTITKNSTVSTDLTGLSAKTTYYVRIRTYKTVDGVKVYSGWSTVKSAKTK